MTTSYIIKKCNKFGYTKSLKHFIENNNSNAYILSTRNIEDIYFNEINDEDNNFDSSKYTIINDIENIGLIHDESPTIIIDLNDPKIFSDIHIIVPEEKQEENSNEYVHDNNEILQQFSKCSCLDAFTSNKYTVIYGKKKSGINDISIKQNHKILDSLAKNGIACDPIDNSNSSMIKLMNNLLYLNNFSLYIIHNALEVNYVEHILPSEFSNPAYTITKGEIVAVFYRLFILNFFGYSEVIIEDMREFQYIM